MNPAQKFNRISLCSSFPTLVWLFLCVCVRHAESVSKSLAKRPGHNCHWASIQMSQIVCQIAHWTWNSFDSLICLPQLPFLLPIWRSRCGSMVCCSVAWPIGRFVVVVAAAAMKHLPNAFGHHLKAALRPAGKCLNAAACCTERKTWNNRKGCQCAYLLVVASVCRLDTLAGWLQHLLQIQ